MEKLLNFYFDKNYFLNKNPNKNEKRNFKDSGFY